MIKTKLVEASLHQGALALMAEQPENVEAILVGSRGSVLVKFIENDSFVEVGKMSERYADHFGLARIKSWKVTGGEPLEDERSVDTEGTSITLMKYFGLNIEFEPA